MEKHHLCPVAVTGNSPHPVRTLHKSYRIHSDLENQEDRTLLGYFVENLEWPGRCL